MQTIERWEMFELALEGPSGGNPFVEVALSAQFAHRNRVLYADGFYDGEGIYRLRFMPDTVGEWRYVTRSNCPDLDGHEGTFTCVEAAPGNYGPVRVHNTYHFAYEDSTPYFSVGTTCQRERAALLPVRADRGREVGLDSLQPRLLPSPGAAHWPVTGTGDRGRPDPLPPLRPLGLLRHGR